MDHYPLSNIVLNCAAQVRMADTKIPLSLDSFVKQRRFMGEKWCRFGRENPIFNHPPVEIVDVVRILPRAVILCVYIKHVIYGIKLFRALCTGRHQRWEASRFSWLR